MLPEQFYHINAVSVGMLTIEQLGVFRSVAKQHAEPAQLVGGTSTSLEEAGTFLSYRLLDGGQISQHLPGLEALYNGQFLELASRVCGRELITSPDPVNGINVNILEGVGSRYEWHVDSNPFTGLLVLTEVNEAIGGRLIFGRPPQTSTAVSLGVGSLLFFDARRTPHAVERLNHEDVRISCPMNFFFADQEVVRPTDLDLALYGAKNAGE